MQNKEAILIGSVLLLAILLYMLQLLHNHQTKVLGEVDIYLNGNLYQTVSIEEGKTFEIVNGSNINTLQFTKNGVYMLHSNCHNQLCVQQGEVNADNYRSRVLGNRIICLPHGLVIYLKLGEDTPKDLPDV